MVAPREPPGTTLADLEEARALYAQLDPAWFDEANDPNAWLSEPGVQKIMGELIEETLAPWQRELAPDDLAVLREELEMAFLTDPELIEGLRGLRPMPERDRSGKVTKGALQRVVSAARASKKAGGDP